MGQINSVSLIIDIIALIIIFFIVARSASKGFISSIISFFGALASIIISYIISTPIAQYIYNSFLKNKIVVYITESIGNVSTDNASHFLQKLEESIQTLPAPIVSLLQSNGQSVVDIVTNNLGQNVNTIAEELCTKIIEPLVTTLISILSFIIIFIVLSIVFHLLEKLFVGIKKIPIIGKLNSLLGAIFGILYSLIVLYVIYLTLHFALTVFNTSLPYITEESLQGSYIFGWLSTFKFF